MDQKRRQTCCEKRLNCGLLKRCTEELSTGCPLIFRFQNLTWDKRNKNPACPECHVSICLQKSRRGSTSMSHLTFEPQERQSANCKMVPNGRLPWVLGGNVAVTSWVRPACQTNALISGRRKDRGRLEPEMTSTNLSNRGLGRFATTMAISYESTPF